MVVDCDEGEGGGNHQTQEEEEFDNDPYEEMEEEEEMPYEVEGEVERDNNEVEIIMEEDSTSVEVPRQAQATLPTSQQQSEAISSAGPTGEPPTSFATRSSRGIAPMPRQQQPQHLLLVGINIYLLNYSFVLINLIQFSPFISPKATTGLRRWRR